jgi:hypothetical protein
MPPQRSYLCNTRAKTHAHTHTHARNQLDALLLAACTNRQDNMAGKLSHGIALSPNIMLAITAQAARGAAAHRHQRENLAHLAALIKWGTSSTSSTLCTVHPPQPLPASKRIIPLNNSSPVPAPTPLNRAERLLQPAETENFLHKHANNQTSSQFCGDAQPSPLPQNGSSSNKASKRSF